MTERWDRHFCGLALYHARLSKDPATQVGSVIIGPDREVLSAGFNGFPRGIADTPERLEDRETKLKLVVHAEMNALLAAARTGMRLKGCTLYLACTDRSGLVWGGPPCTRCTVEMIQVGISEIVSYPVKTEPSKWHEDLAIARALLEEAGIAYREIPGPPPTFATADIFGTLRELVELKRMKERDGPTEEYTRRKQVAWRMAYGLCGLMEEPKP
jgi:dCMP deaminase